MPFKRTPGLRLDKYTNRLFYGTQLHPSESISPVMLAQKDTILAMVSEAFTNICEFEQATKTVLDEEGLSTTQYPSYLNFSRQVYKAQLAFGGNTLINRVNIILQRWVADGYTQAILERIRDEVWTLPAPGP